MIGGGVAVGAPRLRVSSAPALLGAVNSVELLHGAWIWIWGRGGIGEIPPIPASGGAPQQQGPGSAVCGEGERWGCAFIEGRCKEV